ncbi:MAG: flavodoxin [Clostridiales bacterium]|nr:flavodoxin [Clostridiales bacterium]
MKAENPKILFVNGCPRGEQSRTLMLARKFLDKVRALRPDAEIVEADLNTLNLQPMDAAALAKKDVWCDEQDWSRPELQQALMFQQVDAVVIAAPYWDYSFPAIVKVWVENIWVRDLTFTYEGPVCKGLCRGKCAVYITTSGSPIGENDWGTGYIRAVMQALGIPDFYLASAQGLDLDGADVLALLDATGIELGKIAAEITSGL